MRKLTLPHRGAANPRLLFQARGLLLCTLPLRRISATRVTRRARLGERAEIRVTFAAVDPRIPLPYGADRALLAWIQTRALRDGTVLFDDLNDFLDTFGLNASGANYARFRQRLERLANFTLQVRVTGSELDVTNAPPIERVVFPDTPGHRRPLHAGGPDGAWTTLHPRRYGLQLSGAFHRYLCQSPVPLPLPLLRRFRARPLAWDLASFTFWRCHAARRPSVVPWRALVEHLGSRDRDPKQLRRSLAGILDQVRAAYPGFPVRLLPRYQGLAVAPWRPRL